MDELLWRINRLGIKISWNSSENTEELVNDKLLNRSRGIRWYR
jgi:hypothetical protein